MGANIPYPYEIPIKTAEGKYGYWTVRGAVETVSEMMGDSSGSGSKPGSMRIKIDGGLPPKGDKK